MLFSFRKVSLFQSKTFIVLQIKEMKLSSMDLDRDWCQFIAKSINNDGKLTLDECKMTKHGYETLSDELGDKQVIKL